MPAKLNDHYLIINVSLHLDCIIQELRSPLITTGRQGAEIVIVSPHHTQVETEIARLAEIHSELYFKEADTTKIESLRAVGAQSARSILILAPPNGDQLSPLRTLVTLKHLLLEHGVTVNTTVELTDPQSVVLIHELSQGYPGSLDYLAQGELNSLMLAQSILNPGLTGFYRDLMSISGDNNEAYMVELPSAAEDMSFVEYARLLLDQHRDYPYLLVGVKRPMNSGYRLICNPRAESELFTLKRGDFLILLSYDPPEKGTLPLSSSN